LFRSLPVMCVLCNTFYTHVPCTHSHAHTYCTHVVHANQTLPQTKPAGKHVHNYGYHTNALLQEYALLKLLIRGMCAWSRSVSHTHVSHTVTLLQAFALLKLLIRGMRARSRSVSHTHVSHTVTLL